VTPLLILVLRAIWSREQQTVKNELAFQGRFLRSEAIFGQIRTLELRNSARLVQTPQFAFSFLGRSLAHV
jgi:hypothetical protein